MPPKKRQRSRIVLDSDDEQSESSQASNTSGLSRPTGTPKSTIKSSLSAARKKGKSSTLHSFFNARTQAQKLGSRASSRDGTPAEELDGIEEDISEQEEPKPTSGKRKYTPSIPARVDSLAQKLPTRPVPAKLESTVALREAQPAASPPHEHSRPWVDLFPPLDLDELAIHKKKVQEVDEWLRVATKGHPYRRLLVLKGPAGSGKTATISILAKARNLQVVEWSNPNSSSYGDEDYQSTSTQFDDFLSLSAPFTSLSFSESAPISQDQTAEEEPVLSNKLTLIEEVHVIARWSPALLRFRQAIQLQLSSTTVHPIVIIISEEDSTFSNEVETLTAHQLLGPEIMQDPAVSVIEFNPVAPTFISKALDLIIRKEARLSGRRRIPGAPLLRALAETGDVRSAIGMLEMICLNENDSSLTGRVAAKGQKVARNKTPLSASEQATLNTISHRESSLGMFHAVGKVVYNKREAPALDQPPAHLGDKSRPLASLVDSDELFAQTATDIDTFLAALHENYPLSCEAEDTLEHIEGCLENLSDADLIASLGSNRTTQGSGRRFYQSAGAVDALRHGEMVFNIAVRGLLFSLPQPVKRKTRTVGFNRSDPYKMLFPASVKLKRKTLENQEKLNGYTLRGALDGGRQANARQEMAKNGVESWALASAQFGATRSSQPDTGEAGSMMALRRLDRSELVTSQLPFVVMIASAAGNVNDVSSLKELACFDDRLGDTVDLDAVKPGRKLDRRQPSGISGVGSEEGGTSNSADRLVLSDDDIEDD